MNDKPKLMKLNNPYEVDQLVARKGELNVPGVITDHSGSYAIADEVRAYRAFHAQSSAEPK